MKTLSGYVGFPEALPNSQCQNNLSCRYLNKMFTSPKSILQCNKLTYSAFYNLKKRKAFFTVKRKLLIFTPKEVLLLDMHFPIPFCLKY